MDARRRASRPGRPAGGPVARVRRCPSSAPARRRRRGSSLQNAGTATWRSRGGDGVQLSYHWLDDRGNAIVWDGPRRRLPQPVAPGEELEVGADGARAAAARPLPARLRPRRGAPLLVRRGRLARARARRGGRAADRASGGSRSSSTAARTPRRPPRSPRRRSRSSTDGRGRDGAPRRGRATRPGLVAGACSTPTRRASWRSAARSRARDRALRPWAPGGGRNPAFAHPLLLPSLLDGLEPGEHEGLPGLRPRRRAVALRRADQTSTATRSSTRLKTNAPSASATTPRRRGRARRPRRATRRRRAGRARPRSAASAGSRSGRASTRPGGR